MATCVKCGNVMVATYPHECEGGCVPHGDERGVALCACTSHDWTPNGWCRKCGGSCGAATGPREQEAGGQHGDERGVDLAALYEERYTVVQDALALIHEADRMADDCDANARAATTWGDRWKWWTAKASAMELAWHLSHIQGTPRDQATYTSLRTETPWGVTLPEAWDNWIKEARGENVLL